MKKQILEKLQLKDLQNYHKTLTKRLQQLRSFNLQLYKDNQDISQRITSVRAQLNKKQVKKVNKSNFDFDDLYSMGVKKMGNGVINLFTGSKEKIRKFGIFAKNFIAQPKSNPNNQNPNQPQPQIHAQQHISQNQQQKVNEHADFNSYDISVTKYFKSDKTKAQNNLQYAQQKVNTDQIKLPRKKIFNRKEEEELLAKKRLEKSKSESSEDQDKDLYAVVLQQEKPSPQKSKNLLKHQAQLQPKVQVSIPRETNQKIQSRQQKQKIITKKERQIKQIKVQPNKVVDLQNDDSQPQQQAKQKSFKPTSPIKQNQKTRNIDTVNQVPVTEKQAQKQNQEQ